VLPLLPVPALPVAEPLLPERPLVVSDEDPVPDVLLPMPVVEPLLP